MRCKVYRSLDRPQAFFGIKGRYLMWFLLLAGADLALALAVGLATAGVFGFVLFVIGAVAAYILVMAQQDKASDREFSIRLDARRYPRFYRVSPAPFREMLSQYDNY